MTIKEFVLRCEQIWPGAKIAPESLNEQIGNTGKNMAYEQKDGEGSLFKNDKEEQRNRSRLHRLSTARRCRLHGQRWKKQAKSGVSFLKLSLRPKGETTKKSVPFDDDLSF